MRGEADKVLRAGAPRAALLIAWAGMEATLRRAALRAGRHGQVGVQPSVLIRELHSAGVLSPKEARLLEEVRQVRTSSAHGLAPVDFDLDIVPQVNDISRRMLADSTPNLVKQKEIANISAIEAVEAYSVIVSDKLSLPLFEFFSSRGLQGRIEPNVIEGTAPQHDIQIQKSIEFKDFFRLLNEWKESYVND